MKKVVYTSASSRQSKSKKASKVSKPKVAKYSAYRIVWRDAFSESDEWHDEESIDSGEYLVETIGYLVNSSRKNYYTIAGSVTQDDHFCSIINIPKDMVITKTQIKI